MSIPPSPPNYTQREIQKIWADIQEILESIKEIETIIIAETKNTLKNNSGIKEENDNCIYIVPGVLVEFDKIRTQSFRIEELVSYYDRWVEQLYTSVILNKGKFGNKKIAKHLVQAHSICNSINKILDKYKKI